MRITIQLHTKLEFWAVEVQNISTYTLLTAELQATSFTSLKLIPQLNLSHG